MATMDKNIPIPPAGRKPKYPFRKMKVGDSFEMLDDDYKLVIAANTFSHRNPEFDLVTRTQNGKTRVWRRA